MSVFDYATAQSNKIRIETGYDQGEVITPFYDLTITKIVAHGSDRDNAIANMLSALQAIKIEGIKTNIDFLIACMEHEAFRSAVLSTGFVEANLSSLVEAYAKAA